MPIGHSSSQNTISLTYGLASLCGLIVIDNDTFQCYKMLRQFREQTGANTRCFRQAFKVNNFGSQKARELWFNTKEKLACTLISLHKGFY